MLGGQKDLLKYVQSKWEDKIYELLRKEVNALWTYWVQLTMVAKCGGYHASPLKGFCAVTPCNPFSPKILKIFMDAVMRQWLAVVSEEESGPEVLGRSMQRLVEYFYDNNGMVMTIQAGHLQRDLESLVDLFYHVVLRTNVCKMVSMVYQSCHSPENMLL